MPSLPRPPPIRGFSASEYVRRRSLASSRMRNANISALLLTTRTDVEYFSGLRTQFWASPTRPYYFILPRDLDVDPIAVFPKIVGASFRPPFPLDVRTWSSPCPEDDGVSLAIDALLETSSASGSSIGLMMGPETRIGFPYQDVMRIVGALGDHGRTIVSGDAIPRAVRSLKSPAEIEKIRRACEIATDAFAILGSAEVSPPTTEREACRTLRARMIELGADDVPYLIGQSGPGGYDNIVMGPTDRALEPGDIFVADTGARWDGYYCDFCRNYSIGGSPTPEIAEENALLWDATEAAIDAAGPGVLFSDLHRVLADATGGRIGGSVGRCGHELGLDLTEGASITATDDTPLEAGMVITIEPGLSLVHEENLVITETGAELLSGRAPREMQTIECSSSSTTTTPSFDLFDPSPPRANLGLVQIASDMRLDVEAHPLLSQVEDVTWRFQKLEMRSDRIASDVFLDAEDAIRRAAGTFRPKNSLTAIGLACTSLSFVLGPERVRACLLGDSNDAATTDMATSVTRALSAVGAQRIAVLTPYVDEVHAQSLEMLLDGGFDVGVSENLGLATDRETSAVSQRYIAARTEALVLERGQEMDIDGVLIACSAFKACTPGFVDRLEEKVGVPVVTSQHKRFLWDHG